MLLNGFIFHLAGMPATYTPAASAKVVADRIRLKSVAFNKACTQNPCKNPALHAYMHQVAHARRLFHALQCNISRRGNGTCKSFSSFRT